MTRSTLHTLLMILATALFTGCALYPVVQVAGGAMTGYDAAIIANDYLPRNGVEGGESRYDTDRMLQRRLRERLRLHDIHVAAHVIDANAYLVGPVKNRTQANNAIKVAVTVQCIKTITCKFYHAPTIEQAGEDEDLLTELTSRFKAAQRLDNVDLRVEMVGTNAILIGKTDDYHQKTEALAIASEIGGITEIIDYITVKEPLPEAPAANDDAAASL